MPTPLEADEYLSLDPTLSRDEARALADADNKTLGLRDLDLPTEPDAPRVPSTVASPRPGPTAEAQKQIDRWTRQRMNGEINDYRWEREIDPQIRALLAGANGPRHMSAQDQNFLANEIDAQHTQDSIAASIDAAMKPATSPSDYHAPVTLTNPEDQQLDVGQRQDLYDIQVSREFGDLFLAHYHDAKAATERMSPEQIGRWREREIARVSPHDIALVERDLPKYVSQLPTFADIARRYPERLESAAMYGVLARWLESRARTQAGR